MFLVGEFSKLTRVTIKMLRHYDEIGLLKPAATDRRSGYRYYSVEQLPRLNRIIALKDLGFPLEDIMELIDGPALEGSKAQLFARRRIALIEARDKAAYQLRQLDGLMATQQPLADETYDVIVRAVPGTLMATMRQRVDTLGPPVARMFEHLEVRAAAHRVRAPTSPILLFHDEDFREEAADVEASVPVTKAFTENGITVREVGGATEMACVIYSGAYEQTGSALAALLTWMERHARHIGGPLREVYLRFGADQVGYKLSPTSIASRADAFVTEIQIPLSPPDRRTINRQGL